ncbi:DUF448 domain-containing protein [Mariprofundus erugo]|nr:DUF448 domain-containing protein [Mariprofundus erugo]
MTDHRDPMRRCIICRQSLPADAMLRLIVDEEGQIWPDLLRQLPGRGAYHCMGDGCLSACSDKRLQVLKKDFSVVLPQWEALRLRIEHVLDKQQQRMFSRLGRTAAIGRDAVMHRLWNNAPVVLLLAEDAGDALVRQIQDAADKRGHAGDGCELVRVAGRDWLGRMLGRDQVAVAALDASAMAGKLKQYCVWYGRMKVSG